MPLIRRLVAASLFAPAMASAATALPAGGIAWMWDGARVPQPLPAEIAPVVDQILFRGTQVLVRPGHPPRGLPPTTRVTPVVHVEMSVVRPPIGFDAHESVIVHAVVRAARRSTSGWVQLDLETHPSQRAFYRRLVRDVRTALPASTRLSVTALAWWCRSGDWLDGLAADEVVPMFFRMGRDGQAMRGLLANDPDHLQARCRGEAAGFWRRESGRACIRCAAGSPSMARLAGECHARRRRAAAVCQGEAGGTRVEDAVALAQPHRGGRLSRRRPGRSCTGAFRATHGRN